MKCLKKYALLLSYLLFIILGAAMPYLASYIQDVQINELQKKMELSTVNLTLRQEGNLWPVLQLLAKDYTESPWEGETLLTKSDARNAALAALETMDEYGLLPEDELEHLMKATGNADPFLAVPEDGSSALLWSCTWDYFSGTSGTFITVDDITGKAVRILIDNTLQTDGPSQQLGDPSQEDIHLWLEKWTTFLQDYYDIELTGINGAPHNTVSSLSPLIVMNFSSKDGSESYDLSLMITNQYILFNYH